MTFNTAQENQTNLIVENSERNVASFPLQIGKLLGRGGTAVVYQGTYRDHPVAIKALLPGADEVVRDFFLSEGKNLRLLRRGWQQCWPEKPMVIPELYADEIGGAQPFLVMELVDGRTLEALGSEGSNLPEADALNLAVQFGSLLVVLHEELNKCYADVKYENLYLLNARDANNGRLLKVLDWNVLSDSNSDRVARDLFYASIFLFKMLTNADVQYRGIRLQTRLESMEAFQKLSTGLQRFLLLALHSNQARRFQTAREWMDRLQTLVDWWQKEPQSLNQLAVACLKKSKDEQEAQHYSQAAQWMNDAGDILNISNRKGRGDQNMWEVLNSRVQSGLKETSELEIGKTMLAGKMFDKAAETFKRGADLSPLDPEKILRWYWLANAAQQMGLTDYLLFDIEGADQKTYNRLESGVEYLLAGDYPKAEEIFQQACIELKDHVPTGLQALANEARIYNLASRSLKSQQAGDYDGAAGLLEQAYSLYREMPTEPRTNWAGALGDVYQLWQLAIREAETLGLANKYLAEANKAVDTEDWAYAAQQYQSALLAAEDNHEAISSWQKTVERRFVVGDLNAVNLLSAKAFGLRGIKDSIMPIRKMMQEIQDIRQAAADQRIREAVDLAKAYYNRYLGNTLALGKAYLQAMEDVFEAALVQDEIQLATDSVLIAANADTASTQTWNDRIQEYVNGKEAARETALQQVLDEIQYNHKQNVLANSIKAEEKILGFLAIAKPDDPRTETWNELFQKVHEQRARLQLEMEQKLSENQDRIKQYREELRLLKGRLSQMEEMYKKLNPIYQEDHELRQFIQLDRLSIIGRAYDLVYYWKEVVSGDPDCTNEEESLHRLFDQYGLGGWEKQKAVLESHYAKILEKVQEAQKAYEQADIERAQHLLNAYQQIAPNAFEATQLQKRLDEARAWFNWVSTYSIGETQQELTRQQETLSYWLKQELPTTYWKEHAAPLCEKLVERSKVILQQMLAKRDTDPIFSRSLASLLFVRKTLVAVKKAAGELPKEKTTLTEVAREARRLTKLNPSAQKEATGKFFELLDGLDYEHAPNEAAIAAEIHAQRRQRMFLFAGVGGVIGLVVLGVLAYMILVAGIFSPPPPTATPTAPPPTVMPSPVEPTATLAPTSTPEPTPVPVSQFVIPVPQVFMGKFSNGLNPKYLIDDSLAIYEPIEGYWNDQNDPALIAYNGTIHRAIAKSDIPAWILWRMDLPMQEPGLYEIFVSNGGLEKDLFSDALVYEVLSGENPIQPVAGSATTKLLASNPLEGLKWISLGVYSLSNDSMVAVRLNVAGLNITEKRIIPADAILIAKLPEADTTLPIYQNILNEGVEQILFWVDDSQAALSPEADWIKGESHPASWNGDVQIDLAKVQGKAQITWKLGHPLLSPGEYQVQVWVSPNLTANAEFQLKLNGKPVPEVQVLKVGPEYLNLGTRQLLGNVVLKETDVPGELEITLAPQTGVTQGILAGDVIFVMVKK